MSWTYKKKEEKVRTETVGCRGCGTKLKIALLEGEKINTVIVGCDKCSRTKFIKEEMNEDSET